MRNALFIALFATAPAFAQSGLTVDWEWKVSHRCSPASPALVVSGIPSEAKSLQVAMVDLDNTSFNHGGGSATHSGEASVTIPEGALKSYRGPCPGNFASFGHDYQFTIKAIAADGQTELARGSKSKTFSAGTAK
ncbi:MAG: YbhB/YbcL family Raf kinase inhibitor-like protein [Proteobacteria bacterium]|nr:YbhB/YbcL family Raf kinase inhibitor-like protein [Pseudomonadota bacterium]